MDTSMQKEGNLPSRMPLKRSATASVFRQGAGFKGLGAVVPESESKSSTGFGYEAEYLCKIEWLKEAGNRLAAELEKTSSALADNQLLLKKERLKGHLACVLRRCSERYHVILSKAFYTLKSAPKDLFQSQSKSKSRSPSIGRCSRSNPLQTLATIEGELVKLKAQMGKEEQLPTIGLRQKLNGYILYALFSGSKKHRAFDCSVISRIASFLNGNQYLQTPVRVPLALPAKLSPNQEDVPCNPRDFKTIRSASTQRSEISVMKTRESLSKLSIGSQRRKTRSTSGLGRRSPEPVGKCISHVNADVVRVPQQELDEVIAENRKLKEKLAERQKTCDVLSKKLCTLTMRSSPSKHKSPRSVSALHKRVKP